MSKDYDSVFSRQNSAQIFQNITAPQQSVFACGDYFLKPYSVCLDCFRQNQTNTVLNTLVPPAADAIRSACRSVSAIAGYDATNSVNGGVYTGGG
ncbi:4847_t:CDS:1, partial [Ambispora leptoticha]